MHRRQPIGMTPQFTRASRVLKITVDYQLNRRLACGHDRRCGDCESDFRNFVFFQYDPNHRQEGSSVIQRGSYAPPGRHIASADIAATNAQIDVADVNNSMSEEACFIRFDSQKIRIVRDAFILRNV